MSEGSFFVDKMKIWCKYLIGSKSIDREQIFSKQTKRILMMNTEDIARDELLKKFKRVGPMVDGTFTVFDGQSEFHVNASGAALYKDRYANVGSFSQGFAWVRTKGPSAREFHIRKDGARLYNNDFRTVGDFDGQGRAKASLVEGSEFFIGMNGERI